MHVVVCVWAWLLRSPCVYAWCSFDLDIFIRVLVPSVVGGCALAVCLGQVCFMSCAFGLLCACAGLDVLGGAWWCVLNSFWLCVVVGGGVYLLLWLKGFMCGLLVRVVLVRGLLLACGLLHVALVDTVSLHSSLMSFGTWCLRACVRAPCCWCWCDGVLIGAGMLHVVCHWAPSCTDVLGCVCWCLVVHGGAF